MKASEARKITEVTARERMKAQFKEQNTQYNEKAELARKDFPLISKKIRKEIREQASAGWDCIEYTIQRSGLDDPYDNLYLQALKELIEERFCRDGYTVDKFDICSNGDIYKSATCYWALIEISW